MTTPIHAFRADYIISTVADIVRHKLTAHVFDPRTLDAWKHYQGAASECGFTYTADMWSHMIGFAVSEQSCEGELFLSAATIESNLLQDWQKQGLTKEQAWQAMWLV
jgi:hypothetical protein